MHTDTLAALGIAEDSLDFAVPLHEDGPSTGDVALRGVPIGLIHSVGAFSDEKLKHDAEVATRLTHGSPRAISSVTAVAQGVMLAARQMAEGRDLARQTARFLGSGSIADALESIGTKSLDAAIADLGDSNDAAAVIGSGFAAAINAQSFEEAVFAAVNAGGAADSRGALAGALAGARFGASGIPQELIDHLEGRIYISLAAPWFYKTAMRRAGLLIDLHPN
jgi:ADP-ribosylglycohydrolase